MRTHRWRCPSLSSYEERFPQRFTESPTFEDLRAFAEGVGEQRLGDDEQLLGAGRAGEDVGHGRVDRDRGVADQPRPHGGRPDGR